MYDIISIGGATVDIFARPEETNVFRLSNKEGCKELLCFDYGGKLPLEDIHETFGGGAANTSIGFHRLGLNSAIVTLVGNDEWGNKVIENFKREGVSTEFIRTTQHYKSSFSMIINSFEGERTVLYYPGANKQLRASESITQPLSKTQWLFINRISSKDETVMDVLLTFLKTNTNIKVAWNPGGNQIQSTFKKYKQLLPYIDIIFLNKEEAEIFSEEEALLPEDTNASIFCDIHNFEKCKEDQLPYYSYDYRKIFDKLTSLGIHNVVITDGKRGAQVSDGKNIHFCPIVSEKRVDTLGAGDAFATGFTYAFYQHLSLQECLKFGTINATSVVNFFGAQAGLLTKRQMQEQFEQLPLKTSTIKIKK